MANPTLQDTGVPYPCLTQWTHMDDSAVTRGGWLISEILRRFLETWFFGNI